MVSSWTGQLVTHKLRSHRLCTCHQQRVVDTADHAHDTLVLSATLHYHLLIVSEKPCQAIRHGNADSVPKISEKGRKYVSWARDLKFLPM